MTAPDLGYVIFYVSSVRDTIAFFRRAFGFEDTFEHPSGDYGELRTGTTRLAFTAHALAAHVVPFAYQPVSMERRLGMEITLTTPEVDSAFTRAVEAGALPLVEPHDESWGQRVAYVSDPNGISVGIATPMA